MKNIKSSILLLLLALGLSACNSDEEISSQQQNVQIVTGSKLDASMTSATLLGSVAGISTSSYSEVGIAYYPEDNSNDINYAKAASLEYGSGSNYSFSVTISDLLPDATYIYYAYVKDTNGKVSYTGEQKMFYTDSPAELLTFSSIQWVTMNDATLSWDITDDNIYRELTEKMPQASFGIAWSSDRNALTPIGNQFSARTEAVVFNQKPTATVKLVSLNPSTTYYYATYVYLNGKLYVAPVSSFVTMEEEVITSTAPSGVRAIDMGLPSGTKWANMNIGAERAEEAGLFFAWGETVGFNSSGSDGHIFGWGSYKWCRGSRDSQTKYCNNSSFGPIDNKTILDLSDDAAYINWGGEWRTPTNEEMHELIENTTSEWTTLEGVGGYRLTSTSTGNSVFLPAAGCRVSESHYEDGTDCYYWASSIDQDSPYASRYLRFYVGRVFLASMFRYYGMNIRPVYKE